MPDATTRDRFMVADADRITWGQLVKAWATGQKDKPRNLAELRRQCRDAGMAEPHIPEHVAGLVFVQNDSHVLTVQLPPKEMVEAGERWLAESDVAYPLPSFYSRFSDDPAPDADERLELQAARIGEYSINSCM